jgi:hypothetical protein
MTKISFKLRNSDIAAMLNVSEITVKRRLKAGKVDREDFPSFICWLASEIETAKGRGIDCSALWKAENQRQIEEKQAKKATTSVHGRYHFRNFKPREQSFEDIPQSMPSYDDPF